MQRGTPPFSAQLGKATATPTGLAGGSKLSGRENKKGRNKSGLTEGLPRIARYWASNMLRDCLIVLVTAR